MLLGMYQSSMLCNIKLMMATPPRKMPMASAKNMTQPLKCSSRNELDCFSHGNIPLSLLLSFAVVSSKLGRYGGLR